MTQLIGWDAAFENAAHIPGGAEYPAQCRARGQNSPLAAIGALRCGLDLPVSQAMAQEREAFLRLREDPQSKALSHVFFAERAAGRLDRIGGGTMGAGIAAACLLAVRYWNGRQRRRVPGRVVSWASGGTACRAAAFPPGATRHVWQPSARRGTRANCPLHRL